MDICHEMAAYANGVAHMRDSGDDLSKAILNYALKENLNSSMKTALNRFSTILSGIQDYREAQILRLEGKVIQGFSSYGKICKSAKVDLKHTLAVRSREMVKRQHLEKFSTRKLKNYQQITQAEKEYLSAVNESRESSRALENKMELFEAQKLSEIKKVLLEFIKIEMVFHSKALELYTEAYNTVSEINVDSDMQTFRDCLRAPSTQSRLDAVRAAIVSARSSETPVPPVISPLRQCSSLSNRVILRQHRGQDVPTLTVPNRKRFSEPNLSTQGTVTDDEEYCGESYPDDTLQHQTHR